MRHTWRGCKKQRGKRWSAYAKCQRTGESESARVSAARTILEQALKAVDLEDVQQRLDNPNRR